VERKLSRGFDVIWGGARSPSTYLIEKGESWGIGKGDGKVKRSMTQGRKGTTSPRRKKPQEKSKVTVSAGGHGNRKKE